MFDSAVSRVPNAVLWFHAFMPFFARMIAIEETGIIDAQHLLLVRVPATVPAGRHKVLVMIETAGSAPDAAAPDPFDACVGAFAGVPAPAGRNAGGKRTVALSSPNAQKIQWSNRDATVA